MRRAVQITMPTGQTVTPRVVARFDGPLPAPIVKGTKVGTAAVTLPDGRDRWSIRSKPAPTCRAWACSAASPTMLQHYLFGWLS